MKHKIRNENSGFTLVELIITIAVLAVISVPLLKYFSDSMRHNVRMKEQQNAVVAAQNVLEDLKVLDMSLDEMEYLTGSVTPPPGATPFPTMSVAWSSYVTPAPGGTGEYEVKGNYSLNNTSYTVKAKVKPRKSFTNDAGDTKTYHKAEVPAMDSAKDMIATETSNYIENAKFFFHGRYTKHCDDHVIPRDPTITMDYVGQNLKREIHIIAGQHHDDGGNPTNKVDLTVQYQYKWRTSSYPAGIDASTVFQEDIQKVTVKKNGTHNVFVFFTPIHFTVSSNTMVVPDTVVVEGDLSGLGVSAGKEADELNMGIYLVADSMVARTHCTDGAGYKLTMSNLGGGVHNYFSDVFTNLKSTEFSSGTFTINNSTFPTGSGHGFHYDTLMREPSVNRVAEIEVSVYKGDSVSSKNLYTTVNGTKVQSK